MAGPSDSRAAGVLDGPRFELDEPALGRVVVYGPAREGPREHPPLLLVHSINAAASAYEMLPPWRDLGVDRPTYALDLPGFGGSDRSDRAYTPRLMTDAITAVAQQIAARHGEISIDAMALSLSCEFLARAAVEAPTRFRSLALVSPTGLSARVMDGAPGTHRGNDVIHRVLAARWIGPPMFRWLTRPNVVRYFLRRTYGAREIDPGLWDAAVQTAAAAGAEHAPLWFLSGHLFSADATRLYEEIEIPVWLAHGVRGDFVDYRGADRLLARPNWTRTIFESGAMPHFEDPSGFERAYRGALDHHAM